jgi:hypothetical protein
MVASLWLAAERNILFSDRRGEYPTGCRYASSIRRRNNFFFDDSFALTGAPAVNGRGLYLMLSVPENSVAIWVVIRSIVEPITAASPVRTENRETARLQTVDVRTGWTCWSTPSGDTNMSTSATRG